MHFDSFSFLLFKICSLPFMFFRSFLAYLALNVYVHSAHTFEASYGNKFQLCNKKFKGTLSLYCFWQFHFFFLLNLCLPLVFIAQDKLKELTGPGKWEQWTHWKSKTQDHRNRGATKGELEKILSAEKVRKISYCKPTFEKIIL